MHWKEIYLSIGAVFIILATQVTTTGYEIYRFIFLHGPAFMGGWEGQPPAEVCSRLTQTSSQLWREGIFNREECSAMIDRKVTSHIVGSLILITIVTMYHTFQCVSYLLVWSAYSRVRSDQIYHTSAPNHASLIM